MGLLSCQDGVMSRPTAIVYVDGLNLYRQKLQHHPDVKWLNPVRLSELLLPTHDIIKLRYFSSKVKAAGTDPQAPSRQMIYWRALRTLDPQLTVHEGTMRVDKRWMPSVPKEFLPDGSPVKAKVIKIEEKGSDVALASHMVFDAAKNPADLHALVSSDSDFEPTLKLLRYQLGVATALLSPIETPSRSLLSTDPLITKVIRRELLVNSQFPAEMNDTVGRFVRPPQWQ